MSSSSSPGATNPDPPITQDEFIRRGNAAIAAAGGDEAINARLAASQDNMTGEPALEKSLLRQAFSGEL